MTITLQYNQIQNKKAKIPSSKITIFLDINEDTYINKMFVTTDKLEKARIKMKMLKLNQMRWYDMIQMVKLKGADDKVYIDKLRIF